MRESGRKFRGLLRKGRPQKCLILIRSRLTAASIKSRSRGEFRAPLGVRKSPRTEPAVQMLRLWGFEILGKHVGARLAPDGRSWAWILPEYFTFLAEALARCRPIYAPMSEARGHGQGRWPQEREERCRLWRSCQDVGWVQAVPGHEIHLPADPGVGGGALG